MKTKHKKQVSTTDKIIYMLRTKPKYQFPLTQEEQEELEYFVSKIYNPMVEAGGRRKMHKDVAEA